MMFGANRDFPITPTVTETAYSSGDCCGGLQTVGAVRSDMAGFGGLINSFMLASKQGATNAFTIYIFSAKPSSSTFTDTDSVSLNAADVDKLVLAPFSLTPAAPAGTTVTFAQESDIGAEFANQDSPNTVYLYVAIVAGGSYTPTSTTDLVAKIGVTQD